MSVRVRLVSWNLHTPPLAPRRIPRLRAVGARLLAEPRADFLLFQEVWTRSLAKTLATALEPAFAPVRLPGKGWTGDSGGLLSFVRRGSRWRVEERRFHAFQSEGPVWRLWEGDAFGDKGVERIHFERDGFRLSLMNTHLQAQYGSHHYESVRRAQIGQLADIALALDPRVPLILCGDLNTLPEEPLYQTLRASWRDLTTEFRSRCDCGTHVPEEGVEKWLDYLLVPHPSSWAVQVEGLERIVSTEPDIPYSDHHGLEASLRLKPRAETAIPLPASVAWAALAALTLGPPTTRRQWTGGLVRLTLAAALAPVPSWLGRR